MIDKEWLKLLTVGDIVMWEKEGDEWGSVSTLATVEEATQTEILVSFITGETARIEKMDGREIGMTTSYIRPVTESDLQLHLLLRSKFSLHS